MESVQNSDDFKVWEVSARATELARNLGNTRGSVADPDYME